MKSAETFINICYLLKENNTVLTFRLSQSESNGNEEILLQSKSQVLDLDINKEKRTQKFLLLILISHFICILPINILKYVR